MAYSKIRPYDCFLFKFPYLCFNSSALLFQSCDFKLYMILYLILGTVFTWESLCRHQWEQPRPELPLPKLRDSAPRRSWSSSCPGSNVGGRRQPVRWGGRDPPSALSPTFWVGRRASYANELGARSWWPRGWFRRQDVAQHAWTNKVDTEEAPKAELVDGVNSEERCTVHNLHDGDPECGADNHCRVPPGDVDPLRAVARSRNRKARSSLPPTRRCGLLCASTTTMYEVDWRLHALGWSSQRFRQRLARSPWKTLQGT